jgi:hypothetical protein
MINLYQNTGSVYTDWFTVIVDLRSITYFNDLFLELNAVNNNSKKDTSKCYVIGQSSINAMSLDNHQ